MSDSEINQLSHREANSSPDPFGQLPPTGWQGAVARFFKFPEYRTTIRTEVLVGITTFMTMAYILVVNPGILSDAIFLRNNKQSPPMLKGGIESVGKAWRFRTWKLG